MRRRRSPTPPEVRAERERQVELESLDRDTRTVFAYNLPLKAEEKDVFQFFIRAGTLGGGWGLAVLAQLHLGLLLSPLPASHASTLFDPQHHPTLPPTTVAATQAP